MKTYTLKRTGNRPLQFEGELVAEESTKIMYGQENNRWHEFHLYRTGTGRFFLSLVYDSQWQGEERNCQVEELGSIESITEFLQFEYDPLQFMGIRPGGDRTENEEFAANKLLRNYKLGITEILKGFPEIII